VKPAENDEHKGRMIMSKKDYKAIASVLQDVQDMANELGSPTMTKTLDLVADKLCSVFLADNGRFDSVRFKAACGLGG
jgi:hypothetical protein